VDKVNGAERRKRKEGGKMYGSNLQRRKISSIVIKRSKKEGRSMQEQVEPRLQEVSDHELQDITGGLSDSAKTGLTAGGAAVGLGGTIVGGGLLWNHLENKRNERLYGKSGVPGIAEDVTRVASRGRLP